MSLTFGQARRILAQYAGKGGKHPDTQEAYDFTIQILQYLLITGAHGNERKFVFNAVNGCFTAPYELEVPLKVKIDRRVGSVWSQWYEYHSSKELNGNGVFGGDALFQEPDYFPTVYDIPSTGARIAVQGTCEEAEDAHVIIQGKDTTGREVFTVHGGQEVSGEYLSIQRGNQRFSNVVFGQITGVTKTRTNGYVQLYWLSPSSNTKGFLADYSPIEEVPSYRRFKFTSQICPALAQLSVLGRIRLKQAYADTDRIPFENLYAIQIAGQAVNKQYGDDVATAQAKDQFMQELLTRENEYKRPTNGQPIECFHLTSPGSIKNIV